MVQRVLLAFPPMTTTQPPPPPSSESREGCPHPWENYDTALFLARFDFWFGGVFYCCVGVLGVLGNLVAVRVFTLEDMRSTFHAFLVALSVYDALLLSISVFTDALALDKRKLDSPQEQFPQRPLFVYLFPCFLYPLGQIFTTASIYMTVALSVNRYLYILHPFDYLRPPKCPASIVTFQKSIKKKVRQLSKRYIDHSKKADIDDDDDDNDDDNNKGDCNNNKNGMVKCPDDGSGDDKNARKILQSISVLKTKTLRRVSASSSPCRKDLLSLASGCACKASDPLSNNVSSSLEIRRVLLNAAAVLAFSVAYSVPHFFEYSVGRDNDTGDLRVEPTELRQSRLYTELYTIACDLVVRMAIPIAVLCFTSIKIFLVMRRHCGRRPTGNFLATFLGMATLFVLCQLTKMANNIYNLTYHDEQFECDSQPAAGYVMEDVAKMAMIMESSVNFLIYIVASRSFRAHVRHGYCVRRHPTRKDCIRREQQREEKRRRKRRRREDMELELEMVEGRSTRISSVALSVPQGAWYVIFESQSVEAACYFS